MTDIKESPVAEESTLNGYPEVKNINSNSIRQEEPSIRERIAEKTNIMLPNVKELTKKFARAIEEFSSRPNPTPSNVSHNSVNGTHQMKTENLAEKASEKKQAEEIETIWINVHVYETKPLEGSSETSRNSEDVVIDQITKNTTEVHTPTVTETPKKTEKENVETSNEVVEEKIECKDVLKSSCSLPNSKLGGKEVHSLTARSISKEFREELKNNSSRRALAKVDRGSSGESEQVEIVKESVRNRPPTPPIDVQSKRKFWEDIIANAQK